MIRALRARHRAMTGILAVLLPVGFALAIAARPDWPDWSDAAFTGSGLAPPGSFVVPEGSTEWRVEALSLRVALTPANPPVLLLLPEADPRRADVLVYWSPSAIGAGGGVPADARLLGTLAGARPRALPLLERPRGTLLFYGLAQQEMLATSPIPAQR